MSEHKVPCVMNEQLKPSDKKVYSTNNQVHEVQSKYSNTLVSSVHDTITNAYFNLN